MKKDNYLAGNTNSPIPYWEGYPENIVSGKGALVYDENGTEYIDMWMGYGALLFGHAPKFLKESISNVIQNGWFFSYPTKLEKQLAEKLHYIIPSAEKVRFATTGSDAVAYAIRASRVHTKRNKIATIESGYHGVHENLVSDAGTISRELPTKFPFNNIELLEAELVKDAYACLIVEPILANSGTVPPKAGYLETLRDICTRTNTVLIFDEVVTGFRVNIGGAQSEFDVTPDLSTFSKAIAGGIPLSAICGKAEIMNHFHPNGDVFFAGTFNGAPIALNNAISIIDHIKKNPPYEVTNNLRIRISEAIKNHASKLNLPIVTQGFGSMMSISFNTGILNSGVQDSGASETIYTDFVSYIAKNKQILLPPLYTETIFLSVVHEEHEHRIIEGLCAGLDHVSFQRGDNVLKK